MQFKNLLEVLQNGMERGGDAPCWCFKEEGHWKALSWKVVFQRILDLAAGLRKLGLKKGDRVCILSQTRYEWSLADFAIISCGAVTVPVYQSSLAEQASYIFQNAEIKVAFLEDEAQLKKVESVKGQLPHLKQIILFSGRASPIQGVEVYSLDEVLQSGSGSDKQFFQGMLESITPDSDATFVYTSGTTGHPKGAILTHGNFISELEAVESVFGNRQGSTSILFLPLAHIFARGFHFGQIRFGVVQYYAESIDKLLDNIAEIKPQIMGSVPRIFEKVHTRVMQGVHAAPPAKQRIFNWALMVGQSRRQYLVKKQSVPLTLCLKWLVAYQLVFSKLHKKMGGRIQFFLSGGAPLSEEIADFFHAAGFRILEGYGLTETTAAVTCNTFDIFKPGTVGRPLTGVQIKIADDGEILVKGDMVFKGYYNLPEETRDAFDSEGWFRTGDIGFLDEEGFLKITDRKKDIIITAAGKNIAPQNIENLVKTDPLISQVMVHGDRRKYLTALITLDRTHLMEYAKEHRIPFKEYTDLIKSEQIYRLIKTRIDEKNKQLARYEGIKKFALLEQDFSVETGELTPTLKIKRKFTSEKYKGILDDLYQE